MKAAVSTRYGSPDVLVVREVAKPQPKPDEILIRVHATTVNRTDVGMLRPHPFFARLFIGLLRPKRTVLGLDFAGVIETVGENVTMFGPGERVFGMSPDLFGAHAQYLCLPQTAPIATLPGGIAFEEAVVCEGAWYADTYLKAFALSHGQSILIYGASGAIGLAALQLAKSYGAVVTAVAATRHQDLIRSLGADRVIDYTAEDFTQIGETFDFVLDAVGKTSYFRCRRLLKPGGVFAATDLGPWAQNVWLAIWSSISGRKWVIFPLPKSGKAVVEFVRSRLEAGDLRAVIDRTYQLEEIADAYRFVEMEQKTGIVAISVSQSISD